MTALACGAAVLATPSSAPAATVLLGPPDLSASDPFASCDSVAESCTSKTFIPTALPEPGVVLVAPSDGTITSWRVRGAPPAKLRLRIVQALGDGRFRGVATSGAAKVSDGKSDNIAAIGIAAGQQLGVSLTNVFPDSLSTLLGDGSVPGAAWSAFSPGLADEASASPSFSGTGSEPLFNATVSLSKPALLNLTSRVGPQTGGELVVVNGFHLAIATSVEFGGVPAQVVSARNNQIMVVTPPHGPGPVQVTVGTAAGVNDDSPAGLYTYVSVPPSPPDATVPTLAGLAITPPAFTPKAGAWISFRSSEQGSVRFTLRRRSRRGSARAVSGALVARADAGRNRLRLSGRWNGRLLRSGRYRLIATATDALGNRSTARRRAFSVVPQPRGASHTPPR